jgi:hypothetical protein
MHVWTALPYFRADTCAGLSRNCLEKVHWHDIRVRASGLPRNAVAIKESLTIILLTVTTRHAVGVECSDRHGGRCNSTRLQGQQVLF